MKTITVKGVGKISVKPDLIVLSLSLESIDKDYTTAMNTAALKITELNKSLESVGFEKESVKTTNFSVSADYERKKGYLDNYYNVFNGYIVNHHLKVSFDFDTKVLSAALVAISSCVSNPELSIMFTVKDTSAVNEELLKSAAQNAKKKAEILCSASGVTLGDLVNIDYNWEEINIYSRTKYSAGNDFLDCLPSDFSSVDIEPEDINVSDTVAFVWQIC